MISEKFIEEHVQDADKKELLLNPVTRFRTKLIGIVGRRCFHLFDKTNMTWICSAKKLGYEKLSEGLKNDSATDSDDDDVPKLVSNDSSPDSAYED